MDKWEQLIGMVGVQLCLIKATAHTLIQVVEQYHKFLRGIHPKVQLFTPFAHISEHFANESQCYEG